MRSGERKCWAVTAIAGVTLAGALVVAPTNAVAREAVTLSASGERRQQDVDSYFDEATGVGTVTYNLYQKNFNPNGEQPGYIQHKVRRVSVEGKALGVGDTRQLGEGVSVVRPSLNRLRLKVQAPKQIHSEWSLEEGWSGRCTYAGTDGNTYDCYQLPALDPYISGLHSVHLSYLSGEPEITWSSISGSSRVAVSYKSTYWRPGRIGTPGHWDCSIYRREVCKWIPRKPGTPTVRRGVKPLKITSSLFFELEAEVIDGNKRIGSYEAFPSAAGPAFYTLDDNGVSGSYAKGGDGQTLFRMPDTWPQGFGVRQDGLLFDIYAPTRSAKYTFSFLEGPG